MDDKKKKRRVRKNPFRQPDHHCEEHENFDRYCNECQRLWYLSFLGDNTTTPPLINDGEIVIDELITRLAVPEDSQQNVLQDTVGQELNHVGTSCENIIQGLDRSFDPNYAKFVPHILNSCPHISIKLLAKFLNVKNYKTNNISFWMLDMLCLAIKTCQLRNVTERNQKAFVLWFTHIWKAIQFTSSTRYEIFDDLDQMLINSGKYMERLETNSIPNPDFIKSIGDMSKVNAAELIYETAKYLKKKADDESSIEVVNVYEALGLRKKTRITDNSSELLFLEENEVLQHKENIHNDLIVMTELLYSIFAENCTFKLLATLIRHPESVEYWPITRTLKKPKRVESFPPYLLTKLNEYDDDARYPNTKEDKQEVIQTLRNVYDEITEDISKEKIEDTETESEDVSANLKKYSFKHKLHQYIKFSKNPPKFNRYPESDCEEINWSETLLPLHQAVPS
uniref:Uncharacterized protein n=2 Tax=Rhodnius prolixus TaxID=13249 RepID=T1I3J2_RHOPR